MEINLGKLRHNMGEIRSQLSPQTKLLAVVKADAYGHGMVKIAEQALLSGADMLCVAMPEEGQKLRQSGIDAPVIVLGGVTQEGMEASVEHGLIQTVYDRESISWAQKAAERLGCTAFVDIKIDTGMNRIGIKGAAEARELLEALAISKNVKVHGAYTHYAVSEEDDDFTCAQFQCFLKAVEPIKAAYPEIMLHSSNSAGVFLHEYLHLDGVRCGIVMYGSAPAFGMEAGLEPILSWKTRVMHVKEVEAGESVGYGRTYFTRGRTKIATLPVGYGDGYIRALGNKAHVLLGGRPAKVIGRVCMDQIMVDVTDIDVKNGDEAVLIGRQGENEITPWDMALWADTIPYEITLAITQRVPKIYIAEGES
ncbi:MAG: alanine racemase [Christensenellales bacterium]